MGSFDTDPNHLAGVIGLSAAREIIDNVELAESVGHSEYLTDNTTSQYGIDVVRQVVPFIVPMPP